MCPFNRVTEHGWRMQTSDTVNCHAQDHSKRGHPVIIFIYLFIYSFIYVFIYLFVHSFTR